MEPKNIVSQVQQDRLILHEHIPLAVPLVIYIEPSGYCNLKCKFCPHGVEGRDFPKDIMSVELFKKLIDDLAEFDGRTRLLRVCGNGESLMNKNIVEMLKYAKEQDVADRIELVTNGILLTTSLCKELPCFLDRIICSVEGLSADEYERICGKRIDFQKFRDNLVELYANRGECVIHIKTHHEAAPDEERKSVFFSLFSRICDEIYVENLVPMWPQYETAFSIDKFRWGADVVKRKVCAQIFKGMQVQANGEVVPCCVDWDRANIIGDINRDSLFDIWNGEKLKKLQVAHLRGEKEKLEPCGHCAMNDYCEIDNIDSHAEECVGRILGEDGAKQ